MCGEHHGRWAHLLIGAVVSLHEDPCMTVGGIGET